MKTKIHKAIIIDDEPKLRKVLLIKIEKFCKDIQVIGEASSITDGFEKTITLKPQIVFLDISMPGGSGFEFLEKFNAIDFEIIFVTGYNDFVLDALKVSAVDYLLKPVNTVDLVSAVKKAKERILNREKVEMYDILKHNVKHLGEQDTKIAIPGSQAYDFVKIADIVRCEGWQKYTKIFLQNGAVIVSSYNIGVFKDMLNNYGFYTTHKSHLVNTQLIVRYLKEGTVVMKDGAEIPVARRKKEEFNEKILKDLFLS